MKNERCGGIIFMSAIATFKGYSWPCDDVERLFTELEKAKELWDESPDDFARWFHAGRPIDGDAPAVEEPDEEPDEELDTKSAEFYFRDKYVDGVLAETLVLVETSEGHSIHSNCDASQADGDAYAGVCKSSGWSRIDKKEAEDRLGFELEGVHDSCTHA
jgi:hypothetical protein